MSASRRLAGKVALVTGAGSGVGKGIALRFAAEGARVALVGRRAAPLAAVSDEAIRVGGTALPLAADVTRDGDVKRVVAEVETAFGRLDVVVNNAGRYVPRTLLDTRLEDLDETLAVNLKGPFLVARAAYPLLARSRGAVINVSSTLSLRPVPGAAAYAVSKAALDMLTRVLAREWAEHGVRANSILLGIVDTPIHEARPVEDVAAWKQAAAGLHPLGRMGTPGDAAAAAVYLASDEASWTTGALLVVDGGISLA